MRYEIVELQRRLKITVVYVTHDQIEAMSMSDRVIVMNAGVVQQIDSPRKVYQHPVNKFVADFIGMANFIPCEIVQRTENTVRVSLNDGFSGHYLTIPEPLGTTFKDKVVVVIRPEDIDVIPPDGEEGTIGKLIRQTYIGDRNDCTVQFGDVFLRVHTQNKYLFEVGQNVKLIFSNPILLNA